jgi:hypothetical protein
MVKDEIYTVYGCPYCNKEYDDEEDAEECARECIDIESIICIDKSLFICEICNSKYKEEGYAENCEKNHEKNNDKQYKLFTEITEKNRLLQNANHPNQVKLEKWGLKW